MSENDILKRITFYVFDKVKLLLKYKYINILYLILRINSIE